METLISLIQSDLGISLISGIVLSCLSFLAVVKKKDSSQYQFTFLLILYVGLITLTLIINEWTAILFYVSLVVLSGVHNLYDIKMDPITKELGVLALVYNIIYNFFSIRLYLPVVLILSYFVVNSFGIFVYGIVVIVVMILAFVAYNTYKLAVLLNNKNNEFNKWKTIKLYFWDNNKGGKGRLSKIVLILLIVILGLVLDIPKSYYNILLFACIFLYHLYSQPLMKFEIKKFKVIKKEIEENRKKYYSDNKGIEDNKILYALFVVLWEDKKFFKKSNKELHKLINGCEMKEISKAQKPKWHSRIRGYSNLKMQLFRQVGLKDDCYRYTIRRKIVAEKVLSYFYIKGWNKKAIREKRLQGEKNINNEILWAYMGIVYEDVNSFGELIKRMSQNSIYEVEEYSRKKEWFEREEKNMLIKFKEKA